MNTRHKNSPGRKNKRGKDDLELESLFSSLAEENFLRDEFAAAYTDGQQDWGSEHSSEEVRVIPDKDGQRHTFIVRKVPVFDSKGGQQGLVVIGSDVTDQLKAEEALRDMLNSERTAREQAEIMREVTQTMTESLDLNDVLGRILKQLRRVLTFDTSSVLLFQEKGSPALVAGVGFKNEKLTSQFASTSLIKSPILQQMAHDLRSIVIPDVRAHEGWIWVPGAEHVRSFMCIPIVYQQKLIGALMVDSAQQDFFHEDHLARAKVLAQQMAIAIQNARLYEAERAQLLIAQTLQEVGALLTWQLGLDEVLEFILDRLGRVISYDSVSIQLLDRNGQLELAAGRGFPDFARARQIVREISEETLNNRWRTPQLFICPDAQRDSRWVPKEGAEYVRGWISAPLLVKGRFIGTLSVDSRQVGIYDERAGDTVMAFANQAAIAIENARLFEAERAARSRAEALREAAMIIGSSLSLDEVLRTVLVQIARVLPYESGNIMLVEGTSLSIRVWRGYDKYTDPALTSKISFDLAEDNAAVQVIRSAQTIMSKNTQNDPMWRLTISGNHINSWLGVPLLVRDQAIGMLNLDRITRDGFNDEEISLAQGFAAHAATAIENARLFETEGTRATELEALRQASLVLTASLDLKDVLETILSTTLGLFKEASNGHIFLYDAKGGGQLTFQAVLWTDGEQAKAYTEPRPQGLTMKVAHSGETIIVNDMSLDPIYRDSPPEWHGAIIGLPLKIGHRVVGVMNVAFPTPRNFTNSEVHLLRLLADQAAIAIENAKLYEQVTTERRHLGLLYDISRELATSLDSDEILNRAITLTTRALDGLVGQAFLFVPEKNQLSLRALYGRPEMPFDQAQELLSFHLGEGINGWVALQRASANLPDASRDIHWVNIPGIDDDAQSALSAPVMDEDQLLGVLTVLHKEKSAFSDHHLILLEALCREVSLALLNAKRFQEVQRRLRELTLIHTLSQTFTRRLDLQGLFNEVAYQLAQRLGYSLVEIFLVDGKEMVLKAFHGEIPQTQRMPVTLGVIGRVTRTGQSALVPDVRVDPDYYSDNPATVSELAVPIFRDDLVIGIINIETEVAGQLGERDNELLEVLAGQISIAIDNAVLYQRVRQHAEELEETVSHRTAELKELYELSQEMSYALSYEDLLRLLVTHLHKAVGSNLVAGCLAQDPHNIAIVETNQPYSPSVMKEVQTYWEATISPAEARQLPIEIILTEGFHLSKAPILQLPSIVSVPIIMGGNTVGALIAGDADNDFFQEEHQRLLKTFSNQASAGLERLAAIFAAEHKRLEGLVDQLPVGVLLLDASLNVLVINRMALDMLASISNWHSGEPLIRIGNYPIHELIFDQQNPEPVELTVDQPVRQVIEIQARPAGEQNHQWIVTLRDVTQERDSQARIQMQERLATVGQLAAGIAHDFNNIMAAILVYADLLKSESSLSLVSQDRLTIIQQQVQRAASLIRQILDFSRRSVMEQSQLDLLPFVKELEKLLGRVMPETIRLELVYQQGDYVVSADPVRLQQVYMNLALNARDAMPEGGQIQFKIGNLHLQPDQIPPTPDLPHGDWIWTSVSDTGCGIAAEDIAHIFEPFFTTKPVGQGTGLGLAQVYGIVKQHDGYIDVRSQLGTGTTFTIYLPALCLEEIDQTASEQTPAVDGVGSTVLVAEDDPATREALKAMLEASNYNVIVAPDGHEALDCYQQNLDLIKLVVSDIVMPRMGGIALYQAIKDISPQVKMLLITGHPLSEDKQDILATGTVHWLQKPFSINEFYLAVQSLMSD